MTTPVIGIIITLLVYIIITVYRYGKLNERVEDNTDEIKCLKEQTHEYTKLDSRLVALEKLPIQVEEISKILNNLVGKIDMFLELYKKREI